MINCFIGRCRTYLCNSLSSSVPISAIRSSSPIRCISVSEEKYKQ